jgi:hypothetical protein
MDWLGGRFRRVRRTAKFICRLGFRFEGVEIGEWRAGDVYLVELLAFDPMQSDLRPNCAVAQFAKPPTPLRGALPTSG